MITRVQWVGLIVASLLFLGGLTWAKEHGASIEHALLQAEQTFVTIEQCGQRSQTFIEHVQCVRKGAQ